MLYSYVSFGLISYRSIIGSRALTRNVCFQYIINIIIHNKVDSLHVCIHYNLNDKGTASSVCVTSYMPTNNTLFCH